MPSFHLRELEESSELLQYGKVGGAYRHSSSGNESIFNSNTIVNYTLEHSIVDGVNVDYRVYRIKTRATEEGGAILEGDKLKRATVYTGKVENISNKEAKTIRRKS